MFLIDLLDLDFIDHTLRRVLNDIRAEFGMLTITSLYRIGDKGVHGTLPLRATDLRCKNQSVGNIIEEWTNNKWSYDPKRPKHRVCIYHNVGLGFHLHVQVHENTVRRDG